MQLILGTFFTLLFFLSILKYLDLECFLLFFFYKENFNFNQFYFSKFPWHFSPIPDKRIFIIHMFNSVLSLFLFLSSSNISPLCDCGECVPVVRSGRCSCVYLLLPVCETQSEWSTNRAIRCSDQPVGVWRTLCGQFHTIPHLHFRLLHDKRSSSTIWTQR